MQEEKGEKRCFAKEQAEREDVEKPYRSSQQSTKTSAESLLRNITVSRAVVIEITNRTKNVTLQDFRCFCFSGVKYIPPPFEVHPGFTEICAFTKTPYSLRGSVGVLVCKVDSFFLAIMFSNPFDYILYDIEFALEIFKTDDHLGCLFDIYQRIMRNKGTNSTQFQLRTAKDPEHPTLVVCKGKIRVRASMSNDSKALMKVQVEEETPPPYSQNQSGIDSGSKGGLVQSPKLPA